MKDEKNRHLIWRKEKLPLQNKQPNKPKKKKKKKKIRFKNIVVDFGDRKWHRKSTNENQARTKSTNRKQARTKIDQSDAELQNQSEKNAKKRARTLRSAPCTERERENAHCMWMFTLPSRRKRKREKERLVILLY